MSMVLGNENGILGIKTKVKQRTRWAMPMASGVIYERTIESNLTDLANIDVHNYVFSLIIYSK
jgi:hypothetical protein